jgi:hypothetical protein
VRVNENINMCWVCQEWITTSRSWVEPDGTVFVEEPETTCVLMVAVPC